ncbi:MAG TPA: cytochrome P450 [Pilimelia sp.]|nr:cytochrome P450 [Pilimelia sp.]
MTQTAQPAGRSAALLSDPVTFVAGVPHGEFARLRRDEPVSWVPERPPRGGTGFWAVTRYDAVATVSRTPEIFSAEERGVFLTDPRTREDLDRARQMLTNMDGPRHARMRRLVTPAFSPAALRSLRASVDGHAERLVDEVLAAGEFDAVADLAAELPLLVLADLLGIPRSDRGLLLRWSNHLVGFDDPEYGGGDVAVYRQTFVEAAGYVAELAAQRRRRPGDDLVSRLLGSEVDGERLTEAQLLAFWMLLVVAGNETTRHLISGALAALAEWPAAAARLAADPDLVPTAAEEMLRWVTPIMQFRRTATADTELSGQPIRAGDKVVIYYISANRDEAVFAKPDRLDVARSPNPHLAFGTGPHTCLGARLAHAEFQALLRLLLPHLRRFELTGPPRRLESNFVNGIKSMPARFRS